MTYSTGILLGRIVKTSGFNGAVTVKLEKHFSEEIQGMESVFIETEGRPVPFFVSSLEDPGGGIIKLTFRHYDSDVSMRRFIGCRVLSPAFSPAFSPALRPGLGDTDHPDLPGFTVSTAGGTLLGTVTGSIDNKGQIILELRSPGGREILVPLHHDLVVEIDPAHKTLILDLPEGIDEIN
jgi:16S rRNA processing protein RimM